MYSYGGGGREQGWEKCITGQAGAGAGSPYRDHQSARDHLGGEDIRGGVRRFGVLVVVVRRPKVVRLH